MRKKNMVLMTASALLLGGCAPAEKYTAEGHYSGCSFIVPSGDYYNVGLEIHYNSRYNYDWNYSEIRALEKELETLADEEGAEVALVDDGRYYCTDVKRSDGISWRTGVRIPASKHDELVDLLNGFTYTVSLEDVYSDQKYEDDIILPLVDLTPAEEEAPAED